MRLEDFELGQVNDWAGFMLIRVFPDNAEGLSDERREEAKLHIPLGYVFVIDPKFGPTVQYKLPAGHRNSGETPFDTAIREVQGETGISVPPDRVVYTGKQLSHRGDHWRTLFVGDIFERELRQMHDFDVENEGEKPKYFTVAEFYECVRTGNFMRPHFKMLEDFALILPFGRDKVA